MADASFPNRFSVSENTHEIRNQAGVSTLRLLSRKSSQNVPILRVFLIAKERGEGGGDKSNADAFIARYRRIRTISNQLSTAKTITCTRTHCLDSA